MKDLIWFWNAGVKERLILILAATFIIGQAVVIIWL